MGQKFKVNEQKEEIPQQQKINKMVMKRQQKGSGKKGYVALAIIGLFVAGFIFLLIVNAKNKSRLLLEDVHADYYISTNELGKQYHIKEHIKKEAHPDYKKHSERFEAKIDPDWEGHQKEAKYIIRKFQEYNNITLDKQLHYEGYDEGWKPMYNIMNDETYCSKSDLYHLMYPDSINKNYFIFSDFDTTRLSREVVSDYGIDVLDNVENIDGNSDNYLIGTKRIPEETALIHSSISRLHHYFELNKQLFCIYQTANHIPGKWAITGKDSVIDNYRTYYNSKFQDPQACRKTMTSMPRSFRLYDQAECQSFFTHIQSQEYADLEKKEGIVYILKEGKDIHRGEGVYLVTPELKQKMLKQYNNGKSCGAIKDIFQIQKYISNPMKYEGHKIEVRMFFFIASTNPLIIYTQKLPMIKKCGLPYDPFNYERGAHICNVSVSINTNTKEVNLDMFFEELTEYLLSKGVIKNPKWIEETILPQVYRSVVHLVRSGQHELLKDSRFNENFAIDFLIDENQRVWFMENNPNPQVMRNTFRRTKRNQIMFGDLFQIQFAYLRSRALRISKFAKFLLPLYQKYKSLDVSDFKRGFVSANVNDLEPEFENEIRKDSSFVKVFDDNLVDEKKFMGYLPKGCLIEQPPKVEDEKSKQVKV